MRRLFACKCIVIILLCGLTTVSYAATTLADSKKIFQLINARFDYMQNIAAYKYVNHVPVTVPIHERVIMKEAVSTGLALGLNGQTVRQFYEVQVAIAKDIQRSWMRHWDAEHGLPKTNKAAVSMWVWRMRLHTLDVQLLQQIIKAMPIMEDAKLQPQLRQQAITEINNPVVTLQLKLAILQSLLRVKAQ